MLGIVAALLCSMLGVVFGNLFAKILGYHWWLAGRLAQGRCRQLRKRSETHFADNTHVNTGADFCLSSSVTLAETTSSLNSPNLEERENCNDQDPADVLHPVPELLQELLNCTPGYGCDDDLSRLGSALGALVENGFQDPMQLEVLCELGLADALGEVLRSLTARLESAYSRNLQLRQRQPPYPQLQEVWWEPDPAPHTDALQAASLVAAEAKVQGDVETKALGAACLQASWLLVQLAGGALSARTALARGIPPATLAAFMRALAPDDLSTHHPHQRCASPSAQPLADPSTGGAHLSGSYGGIPFSSGGGWAQDGCGGGGYYLPGRYSSGGVYGSDSGWGWGLSPLLLSACHAATYSLLPARTLDAVLRNCCWSLFTLCDAAVGGATGSAGSGRGACWEVAVGEVEGVGVVGEHGGGREGDVRAQGGLRKHAAAHAVDGRGGGSGRSDGGADRSSGRSGSRMGEGTALAIEVGRALLCGGDAGTTRGPTTARSVTTAACASGGGAKLTCSDAAPGDVLFRLATCWAGLETSLTAAATLAALAALAPSAPQLAARATDMLLAGPILGHMCAGLYRAGAAHGEADDASATTTTSKDESGGSGVLEPGQPLARPCAVLAAFLASQLAQRPAAERLLAAVVSEHAMGWLLHAESLPLALRRGLLRGLLGPAGQGALGGAVSVSCAAAGGAGARVGEGAVAGTDGSVQIVDAPLALCHVIAAPAGCHSMLAPDVAGYLFTAATRGLAPGAQSGRPRTPPHAGDAAGQLRQQEHQQYDADIAVSASHVPAAAHGQPPPGPLGVSGGGIAHEATNRAAAEGAADRDGGDDGSEGESEEEVFMDAEEHAVDDEGAIGELAGAAPDPIGGAAAAAAVAPAGPLDDAPSDHRPMSTLAVACRLLLANGRLDIAFGAFVADLRAAGRLVGRGRGAPGETGTTYSSTGARSYLGPGADGSSGGGSGSSGGCEGGYFTEGSSMGGRPLPVGVGGVARCHSAPVPPAGSMSREGPDTLEGGGHGRRRGSSEGSSGAGNGIAGGSTCTWMAAGMEVAAAARVFSSDGGGDGSSADGGSDRSAVAAELWPLGPSTMADAVLLASTYQTRCTGAPPPPLLPPATPLTPQHMPIATPPSASDIPLPPHKAPGHLDGPASTSATPPAAAAATGACNATTAAVAAAAAVVAAAAGVPLGALPAGGVEVSRRPSGPGAPVGMTDVMAAVAGLIEAVAARCGSLAGVRCLRGKGVDHGDSMSDSGSILNTTTMGLVPTSPCASLGEGREDGSAEVDVLPTLMDWMGLGVGPPGGGGKAVSTMQEDAAAAPATVAAVAEGGSWQEEGVHGGDENERPTLKPSTGAAISAPSVRTLAATNAAPGGPVRNEEAATATKVQRVQARWRTAARVPEALDVRLPGGGRRGGGGGRVEEPPPPPWQMGAAAQLRAWPESTGGEPTEGAAARRGALMGRGTASAAAGPSGSTAAALVGLGLGALDVSVRSCSVVSVSACSSRSCSLKGSVAADGDVGWSGGCTAGDGGDNDPAAAAAASLFAAASCCSSETVSYDNPWDAVWGDDVREQGAEVHGESGGECGVSSRYVGGGSGGGEVGLGVPTASFQAGQQGSLGLAPPRLPASSQPPHAQQQQQEEGWGRPHWGSQSTATAVAAEAHVPWMMRSRTESLPGAVSGGGGGGSAMASPGREGVAGGGGGGDGGFLALSSVSNETIRLAAFAACASEEAMKKQLTPPPPAASALECAPGWGVKRSGRGPSLLRRLAFPAAATRWPGPTNLRTGALGWPESAGNEEPGQDDERESFGSYDGQELCRTLGGVADVGTDYGNGSGSSGGGNGLRLEEQPLLAVARDLSLPTSPSNLPLHEGPVQLSSLQMSYSATCRLPPYTYFGSAQLTAAALAVPVNSATATTSMLSSSGLHPNCAATQIVITAAAAAAAAAAASSAGGGGATTAATTLAAAAAKAVAGRRTSGPGYPAAAAGGSRWPFLLAGVHPPTTTTTATATAPFQSVSSYSGCTAPDGDSLMDTNLSLDVDIGLGWDAGTAAAAGAINSFGNHRLGRPFAAAAVGGGGWAAGCNTEITEGMAGGMAPATTTSTNEEQSPVIKTSMSHLGPYDNAKKPQPPTSPSVPLLAGGLAAGAVHSGGPGGAYSLPWSSADSSPPVKTPADEEGEEGERPLDRFPPAFTTSATSPTSATPATINTTRAPPPQPPPYAGHANVSAVMASVAGTSAQPPHPHHPPLQYHTTTTTPHSSPHQPPLKQPQPGESSHEFPPPPLHHPPPPSVPPAATATAPRKRALLPPPAGLHMRLDHLSSSSSKGGVPLPAGIYSAPVGPVGGGGARGGGLGDDGSGSGDCGLSLGLLGLLSEGQGGVVFAFGGEQVAVTPRAFRALRRSSPLLYGWLSRLPDRQQPITVLRVPGLDDRANRRVFIQLFAWAQGVRHLPALLQQLPAPAATVPTLAPQPAAVPIPAPMEDAEPWVLQSEPWLEWGPVLPPPYTGVGSEAAAAAARGDGYVSAIGQSRQQQAPVPVPGAHRPHAVRCLLRARKRTDPLKQLWQLWRAADYLQVDDLLTAVEDELALRFTSPAPAGPAAWSSALALAASQRHAAGRLLSLVALHFMREVGLLLRDAGALAAAGAGAGVLGPAVAGEVRDRLVALVALSGDTDMSGGE